MEVRISDPLLSAIKPSVQHDFQAYWERLGEVVQRKLADGPAGITWINLGITHDGDTIGNCIFHRTIAPNT